MLVSVKMGVRVVVVWCGLWNAVIVIVMRIFVAIVVARLQQIFINRVKLVLL